ncbi:class D sortase [Novosphingobium profundi]|uniref:class D sortase n=1 Tax=Novosphingobium profundi TaxID=1774954 RepID=UPI001BDAE8CF|nr:class D sortase [Novosphingobium profundi]MBT0670978.1 class D sortase [Novosphingobium profundi]
MSAGARREAALRGLLGLGGLGAVVCGGLLVMQGVAVPRAAEAGQARLERAFATQAARHADRSEEPGEPSPQAIIPFVSPVDLSHPATPAAPAAAPALLRLSVARLGVREIVTSGEATHDTLASGPIMVKAASAQSPVTILAAHRDTHFLFVRDLAKGDVIELQNPSGARARYRVVRFETVRWDRFSYPRDPARALLALVTCYPFGGTEYGGPLRRVAWAERMDADSASQA